MSASVNRPSVLSGIVSVVRHGWRQPGTQLTLRRPAPLGCVLSRKLGTLASSIFVLMRAVLGEHARPSLSPTSLAGRGRVVEDAARLFLPTEVAGLVVPDELTSPFAWVWGGIGVAEALFFHPGHAGLGGGREEFREVESGKPRKSTADFGLLYPQALPPEVDVRGAPSATKVNVLLLVLWSHTLVGLRSKVLQRPIH